MRPFVGADGVFMLGQLNAFTTRSGHQENLAELLHGSAKRQVFSIR